jgi:indolepyruvate ferredoxin oxidoreductase beta subunit
MKDTKLNIFIAGVGGQGTVLASDVIAEVGIRMGLDAKKSDILGLAVRGGSVFSHVRWAPKVDAPVMDQGDADYLVGFELLEAYRQSSYLKPGGVVLINDGRIDPMTVSSGQAVYPAKSRILEDFEKSASRVHLVPGLQASLDLGNSKVLNIVLLGSLAALLGHDPELWKSVVADRVPPKFKELNLEAFDRGFSLTAA